MSINRKIPPQVNDLTPPSILPHRLAVLSNGLPVYYLHDPDQEAFKLDVVLPTGTYYQPQPVVASSMLNLLNEGTSSHSSEEIADFFDFHGAYIDMNCGVHRSEVSLIALHKHAEQTIGMLAEMLLDSIFPEKELETYLRNKKQRHLVQLENTAYLARMEFQRLLFGASHPYANDFSLADFDRVTSGLLRDFYHERLSAQECMIVLSGNISDKVLNTVSRHFTPLPSRILPEKKILPFSPAAPGYYFMEKKDTVQSSLKIGKQGVRIHDPEYTGFQLLNTILGGYFGSRLMSNIREEKGFTYGIHSFNVNMPLRAYWSISSDVNGSQTEAALAEIKKEIIRLQQEPVSAEELALVKSYYYGELLRELDGVFAQADALKHKLGYGMDNTFYLRMLEELKQCTSGTLMFLAQKHLNTEELYTIICGPATGEQEY